MSFESSETPLVLGTSQPQPLLTENPKDAYLEHCRAHSPNSAPQAGGEDLFGASLGGALVGMGSKHFGPAMQRAAGEVGFWDLAMSSSRSEQWLRGVLGVEGESGDAAFFSRTALANAGKAVIDKSHELLAPALSQTAASRWEPDSLGRSLVKGAGVGVADYALDSLLTSATGMQTFRPNIVDTSLVTAATISPIPGNYKIAAIAAGWSVGRLSNIVGLT